MSLLQAVHLQMTSKTATIQYKPVTSLAGNNNALAHYELSRGFDQISHALSDIHGLYGCSCNLFDVISVYSLNLGKLPGRFSYERLGSPLTLNNVTRVVHIITVPFFTLVILMKTKALGQNASKASKSVNTEPTTGIYFMCTCASN